MSNATKSAKKSATSAPVLSATEQLAALMLQIESLKGKVTDESKAKRDAIASALSKVAEETGETLGQLAVYCRLMANNNGTLPENADGAKPSLRSINGGTFGPGKAIPADLKAKAEEMLKKGDKPVSAIALETGISAPTLNNWKKALGLVKARKVETVAAPVTSAPAPEVSAPAPEASKGKGKASK